MLLIPLVAAVTLLAGCSAIGKLTGASSTPTPTSNGVETMAPDAIMSHATAALAGASSVRVFGTYHEGPLDFQIDLTLAGTDVKGTAAVFGIDASLIKVGTDYWVQADASSLSQLLPQQYQSQVPNLTSKWLKVDLSLIASVLPPLQPADYVKPVAPLTKGNATTVGSTPAITVTDANGTVYTVATVGQPYLLKVTSGNKDLTFGEFGSAGPIQAPAASDTYNIQL
jgi:hypothetical protein